MIEGCFFTAQLKSHQHNDHSVAAANSSRHTIVCRAERERETERKNSCIGQTKISVCVDSYLAQNWQLTELTNCYTDHSAEFFLLSSSLCISLKQNVHPVLFLSSSLHVFSHLAHFFFVCVLYSICMSLEKFQ